MERKLVNLPWPVGGLNRRFAHETQPPTTTPDATNVRPDSAGLEGRRRGGSRPGIGKYSETQFGSGNPVRMLNSITWIDGGTLKTRVVLIANGSLQVEDAVGAGGSGFTATTFSSFGSVVTGGTFNPAKNLQSDKRNQVLYIADHADDPLASAATYYPKKFNPATNLITQWTASTGTLPLGCNCLCLWRDRMVLAGGTTNPYGIFLSRQSDPDDWDFGFSDTDTGKAVSLALADAGQIGDVVTCLAPHTDNCLIVGCHTSLWILRNDPGYGGILDNLSQHIGVVDRGAFCTTPEGLMVFLSRDGLYAVPASCTAARFPTSISRERLPRELLSINRDTHTVSMSYDVLDRGIHIYVTPNTAGTSAARGWWFDWEGKSFWPVDLSSPTFEPFVMHERENYHDLYSPVIFGCRDGHVRRFRWELSQDDGFDYPSHCLLGPLGDPSMTLDTLFLRLGGHLDMDSADVEWSILPGRTPEEAATAEAWQSGIFTSIVSPTFYPRVRGRSLFVKLANKEHAAPWAWESGFVEIEHVGRARS